MPSIVRRTRPLPAAIAAVVLTGLVAAAALSTPAVATDTDTRPAEGIRRNPPKTFALTGVTLVPRPGVTVENATVVVRGTKVTAAGAGVDVPPGTTAIDGSGRTVYAGFIDSYHEVSFDAADTRPEDGYWNDQIRSDFDVTSSLTSDDLSGPAGRKSGFVARLIAPQDGILRGRSAVVSLGPGEVSGLIVRPSVALHGELTLGRRRSRDSYPNSPMGAVALARQAFYDARWQADAEQAVRLDPSLPAPEANSTLAAMRPALDGELPLVLETGNELFAVRAADFAAEFGLNLILRGSGREYRRLEEISALGRPVILPLAFPKSPDVSTPQKAEAATLRDLMHWDLAPANAASLHDAGVELLLTAHGLDKPGDFLGNLRLAVKRGLPEEVALASLTTTPARRLGVRDQLGTVEAGKLASFVVTDGPLLEKGTKVVETWVAGRRYEHDTDDRPKAAGAWLLQADTEKLPTLRLTIKGEKSLSANIAVADASADQPRTITLEDTDGDGEPDKFTDSAVDAALSAPSQPDFEGGEGGPSDDADQIASDASDESAEKKRAKVKGLEFDGSRLTGRFDAGSLGGKGIATLSLLAIEGEDEWLGTLTWPDGTSASVTASRVAEAEEAAAIPEDDAAAADAEPPSDEDSLPEGAPDATDEAVTNQPDEDDAADDPADADPAEEEDESAEEDADHDHADDDHADHDHADESAAKADSGDDRPSDKSAEGREGEASFPVNYPLGAYGFASLPESQTFAITGVTAWTCGPEGTIENATVLVRDGKIAAVGADIDVPDDAESVDGSGLHLTPGLIDCHSHIASDGGINESGQAITAEVRIGDFVDPDDVDIYWQLAGGLTTANVLHGSANPIGGQNQVIKMRWGSGTHDLKFDGAPQGIKFALGENVKQSNWGDNYRTRYPQTRMGVEQLFRDEFRAAREYTDRHAEYARTRRGLPPRVDLELKAVAEILAGERWVHCHSYRQDEILALIRVLDEFGVTIGSFQHILEGYKVADAMAEHGATGSSFSDWWAYKVEVYDAIPQNGALMHRQGIVVSFNSDDGELGRRMNQEAAKAVKYGGVPPEEALKFVTLNAAIQLRIDDRVGSIEVGKDADLALWTAPPLSNFAVCQSTWVDGRRLFDRGALDDQAAEVAEMRRTLIQKVLTGGAKMYGEGGGPDDPSGLWPRHDEFCHGHGHGHGHGHTLGHSH